MESPSLAPAAGAESSSSTRAAHHTAEGALSPATFGPWLWTLLHAVAFLFPTEPDAEEAAAAIELVDSFGQLFWCYTCLPHLQRDLQAHPVANHVLAGRAAFAQWTVDFHNRVNARLGKPHWTLGQAEERFGEASTPRTLDVWRGALTFAAGFPNEPTPQQRAAAEAFVRAFVILQPCHADARAALRAAAPSTKALRISNREEFFAALRDIASTAGAAEAGVVPSASDYAAAEEFFRGAACADCSLEAALAAAESLCGSDEAAADKDTVTSNAEVRASARIPDPPRGTPPATATPTPATAPSPQNGAAGNASSHATAPTSHTASASAAASPAAISVAPSAASLQPSAESPTAQDAHKAFLALEAQTRAAATQRQLVWFTLVIALLALAWCLWRVVRRG